MDCPARSWAPRVATTVSRVVLTLAIATSAMACGAAAQTALPGNAGASPSSAVESPRSSMSSGAVTTAIAQSPSLAPTPVATVKPVAKIIDPDPSDMPPSPVTAQQMEDAVSAYATANAFGEYTPTQIAGVKARAVACADSSHGYLARLADCEGLVSYAIDEVDAHGDPLDWTAALEIYWYVIGSQGLGSKSIADFDAFIGQYLQATGGK